MANVEKRRRDGKTTWLARWRDPDGRQRKRSFSRRADAERYLTSVQHSVLMGSYIDPAAGKVTFREYAEQWRIAQVHRPTTTAHVETMLRRHAYPAFGDRPPSGIRPSELQRWVKRLGTWGETRGALSPATIGVVRRLVAGVFRAAVKDRMLASSPCE